MGRIIIKPSRDEDFYIEWSSVVEAPTAFGSRDEMLAYLEDDGVDRLSRAYETGTSAMFRCVSAGREGALYCGFDDPGAFIYKQEGMLSRDRLRPLCERLRDDPKADVSDLLDAFEDG